MNMDRYILDIKKDIFCIILYYFYKISYVRLLVELENCLCKPVSVENRVTPNVWSEPGGSRELSELSLLVFTSNSRVLGSVSTLLSSSHYSMARHSSNNVTVSRNLRNCCVIVNRDGITEVNTSSIGSAVLQCIQVTFNQ